MTVIVAKIVVFFSLCLSICNLGTKVLLFFELCKKI